MELGRLAFREEGEFWNAYWARRQDSMEDAILLGSIRMNLAKGGAREGFLTLMQAAFDVIAADVTGQTPTWGKLKAAPENERSGNA